MNIAVGILGYIFISIYFVAVLGAGRIDFEEMMGWALFWPILLVFKAIKGFIRLIKQ